MTIEKFCENYGKATKLVDALQNLDRIYKPKPHVGHNQTLCRVRLYIVRAHYRVLNPRKKHALCVIKGGKVA